MIRNALFVLMILVWVAWGAFGVPVSYEFTGHIFGSVKKYDVITYGNDGSTGSVTYHKLPGLHENMGLSGTFSYDPQTWWDDEPGFGQPFFLSQLTINIGQYTIHNDGGGWMDWGSGLFESNGYGSSRNGKISLGMDDFFFKLHGVSSWHEDRESFLAMDLSKATGGGFGWTPYFSDMFGPKTYNGNWGGIIDTWHRVPDVGSTLGMLAFALGGLGFMRRKA